MSRQRVAIADGDSHRREWAPNMFSGHAFAALASLMRSYDHRNSRRVTGYIPQPRYTADRIELLYGRETNVIGAPLDCQVFGAA